MKAILRLIPFLLLIAACKKEVKDSVPEKQFLFDGLPYYLSDTISYNEGSASKNLKVYLIRFDSKGYAWILDTWGLLYRYNRSTRELICWSSKEVIGIDPAPQNMLGGIYIDSRDRIWCASAPTGTLYLFEGKSLRTFILDDIPRDMSEDADGNIHIRGGNNGKEYICDGISIIQTNPVFANSKYHIYGIYSDGQKNLWYKIDQTPEIDNDQGMFIVKYKSASEYRITPEIQNYSNYELQSSTNIVFDSKNNPYIGLSNDVGITGQQVWTINDASWGLSIEIFEYIGFRFLYIDHEDNIWASLSRSNKLQYFIAIGKERKWKFESDKIEVIKDRTAIFTIAFPDENTVWICTSGGVFEFIK